jgi:Zn-dependent peptidase ImmA (M78 family)
MTKTDAIEMYRYAQIEFGVMRDMLRKRRFKPFAITLPTNVGDNPREAAEITRNSLGIGPHVPIRHLTSALEKAGVLILALPKAFPHREAFSLWAGYDRQRPVIVLSGGAAGDRLRLSIAHELGHLVMHKPVTNPVREIEQQAYRFVGEFLLPEAAMRQELVSPLTLDSFVPLKTRWGVSIQALIVHARALGIITERKYTYLFQQLSRRGWRNREPRMFDVPLEKPRALRQVAEMVYGNPIRYKKIAEDVRMPETLIRGIIEAHATRTATPVEEVSKPKADVVQFSRSKSLVS